MDIVLLSEVIKPHDEWSYPYNALRNHALVRSETDVRSPTHLMTYPHSSVQLQLLKWNRPRLCPF